ncbi:MAG: glycosyltransferase [Gemmataceae bacterium]|nr:glycosyltransferase [Gemmataceae bacterium]
MIFVACFAVVAYVYVGYPLWLAFRAKLGTRPVRRGPHQTSISIVLAGKNEERNLERRLDEFRDHIRRLGVPGEVIFVSDGSTDRSAEVAKAFEAAGLVRVIDLAESVGKSAAVTVGCHEAKHDILIFADCRQTWADDAIERLIENFADPDVGAVSGDLALESAPGVMAGVGLYWKLEKWLRKKESAIGSQVGVTGSIAACRRELFTPIPQGTLLDDIYWPMHVAMQGKRVVHDERARAFDRLPENPRDEFRRKVRTLAGNFQLAARIPASLLPWRNPVWMAWMSRKLGRLFVPWAMLGMLGASIALQNPAGYGLIGAQVLGYALGLLGLVPAIGQRMKLLGAGASFLVLNAAAFLGFWVWILGRADRAWTQVRYQRPVPAEAASVQ